MSQHSSCWLERHQFFIKYCRTERETFKGEGKIEFAVSARALMIMASHKVISGLGDRKGKHHWAELKAGRPFLNFLFFRLLDCSSPLTGISYVAKGAGYLKRSTLWSLHFTLTDNLHLKPTRGRLG